METKSIPLQKDTVRQIAEQIPLGPVVLELPEGRAYCEDSIGFTCIQLGHAVEGKLVAVIAVARGRELNKGVITAFRPDEARSFAASLIGAADQCDGGQKGLN